MKKLLSIILSILMVVTMLPMAVLPASAASEATTLKKNSYTKVAYSNSATQYYQYNNYLYKVAYSNLKNISKVAIDYNAYNYLSLGYTESDTGDTFFDFLTTSYRGSSAKLSNLPTASGKSVSFYGPDTVASNEKNPVVTVTCMAVSEPVWSWNGVSSATAAFTSTDGGATMTVDAAIESSEQTAATCLENDKTTYTATATANGKEYMNVKTIYGEQGPHNFEYIKSGDYMIGSCTNGCGTECVHENQTGDICENCGCHIGSYTNGFCTECDAYEPAELKDGYYQIKNGGQLFWYANYINTVDRTANAVLTADIDLENRPWTPIGSTGESSNNFRGIFDGQNHYIRGLYVEGDRAGLGFFGEVRTGTVKNFTIFGEVVVNTEVDYVGGVIGSVCGVNGENDLERNGAIIQNIRSFVNLTVKAHGVGKIGGFVGYANHQSLIEKCSWYGTFDAGQYRVDSGAGGFIGKIQENSSEVTIRNCGAYGTIKTNYAGDYNDTATIYMGGFLSFSNTSAQTTLENCLFAGKFERGENLTDQAFLGAFGTLRSVNAIKNCYYLGDDGLEAVHSDSNLKPGSDNVEITKVTEEQLTSGETAYKLGDAWGQSIGTDAYPVLGGEEVYCGYTACDDEAMVYTNDSTVSATKPDHAWGEGSLTRPTKTADGYYTYTCSACGETKTEPVERAANYDDYTKALEDLRAYLDSDMLTDENKSNISEWLATYDTDEAYSCIAGEEETVQEYIDATAYYASEFEAAIQECLAGNHSGNGDYCEICGAELHTCDFSGEWKYDADKHWKECECGLKSEEGTHSGGTATCTEQAECQHCGASYGELDADGHDWSNKDGVCANGCGEVCPHEKYTDGICDNCEYACPHEWGEGVLTRPTFETDGYYTYTCTLCGHSYTEPAKEADTTALNDASMKVTEYIDNDTLTQEARDEIYKSYRDILKNNGNVFDEFGFVRGDLVEEDQPAINAITAELEKIIADADEKIASGEYVKADYTEIDEAIDDIEEKLASENVTDEGKAELEEIKKQLEEMKADENTSEADLTELEKALGEYEEELDKGIEDGTLVEVDGDKIADDVNKKWAEKLEAEGLLDEYEDFINNQKATDEAMATVDEINDFANSLEGTVAENAENIAKLNEMLDSLLESWENCLRGTHNFKDYEITSPAKCEVNAKETSTCWFCGETDEREVEGTALEHSFTKYEVTEEAECGKAGKEVAYCDNGCQTTDEREIPALEHIFLDYVSNGDATCTADGTKTAFCIHGCGATDTVADEGSMVDHADEDGDKLCDDCQAEIVDVCPDCGRPVHEDSGISRYICILIMLIRLVISFFKAI